MEVDHFNSRIEGRKRNAYKNLMLSTRHCNGAKSDVWPSSRQRKEGIRFIDCTKEDEFIDGHIVEDFSTHKLVGLTPTGIYHIENLDLNAPHFVDERRTRWRLHCVLENTPVRAKNLDANILKVISGLRQVVAEMIPLPPASARRMPRRETATRVVWEVEPKAIPKPLPRKNR
jgi:hypothetical protein